MAAWLVAAGHQVRVVTAPPYYPAWQLGAGHKAGRYSTEQWQGVGVWRCPLWIPQQPGGTHRVLHLLSFAISSLPVLLRQVFWRPDVVWVAAPAFACTPGALLVAKLSGAPAWLHVQDFEIDVAFDMGLLRGKLARSVVTGLERWLLQRFNVVSSISQRMLQRLAEKGVAAKRIVRFANWVDVQAITPLGHASAYRQELGIAADAVVALFSGTLGAKQGLHLLPEAAKLLNDRCPNIVFVICGDGVMKTHLQHATQGLANVYHLPLQPKDRLGELMGLADIHLLPQDVDVADLVMPSKLTAMLSSGKPVVTNARATTEVAQIVAACGLVTAPGNSQAFADAISSLAENPNRRSALGHAARIYAESNSASQPLLQKFLAQIIALASGQALPERSGATEIQSTQQV